MLDIHSHILPAVDDGAKTIDESLSILEAMYAQGITDVVATPHFYPHDDNLDDFNNKVKKAFSTLKEAIGDKKLPNIYLGCEILYYSGISKASSLRNFTINGSDYMLLELNSYYINDSLFNEILYLREERGIIPIIAHIERYCKARKYKALIEFVKQNKILTQVNSTSFFAREYKRTLNKLFNSGVVSFIATDSHSMSRRPPLLAHAFEIIEAAHGPQIKQKLLKNANDLYLEITNKDNVNEI